VNATLQFTEGGNTWSDVYRKDLSAVAGEP
jgi:hypothetical protein